MRSMAEGLAAPGFPSTALRAVPLPIACGDREDKLGLQARVERAMVRS